MVSVGYLALRKAPAREIASTPGRFPDERTIGPPPSTVAEHKARTTASRKPGIARGRTRCGNDEHGRQSRGRRGEALDRRSRRHGWIGAVRAATKAPPAGNKAPDLCQSNNHKPVAVNGHRMAAGRSSPAIYRSPDRGLKPPMATARARTPIEPASLKLAITSSDRANEQLFALYPRHWFVLLGGYSYWTGGRLPRWVSAWPRASFTTALRTLISEPTMRRSSRSVRVPSY